MTLDGHDPTLNGSDTPKYHVGDHAVQYDGIEVVIRNHAYYISTLNAKGQVTGGHLVSEPMLKPKEINKAQPRYVVRESKSENVQYDVIDTWIDTCVSAFGTKLGALDDIIRRYHDQDRKNG